MYSKHLKLFYIVNKEVDVVSNFCILIVIMFIIQKYIIPVSEVSVLNVFDNFQCYFYH